MLEIPTEIKSEKTVRRSDKGNVTVERFERDLSIIESTYAFTFIVHLSLNLN